MFVRDKKYGNVYFVNENNSDSLILGQKSYNPKVQKMQNTFRHTLAIICFIKLSPGTTKKKVMLNTCILLQSHVSEAFGGCVCHSSTL